MLCFVVELSFLPFRKYAVNIICLCSVQVLRYIRIFRTGFKTAKAGPAAHPMKKRSDRECRTSTLPEHESGVLKLSKDEDAEQDVQKPEMSERKRGKLSMHLLTVCDPPAVESDFVQKLCVELEKHEESRQDSNEEAYYQIKEEDEEYIRDPDYHEEPKESAVLGAIQQSKSEHEDNQPSQNATSKPADTRVVDRIVALKVSWDDRSQYSSLTSDASSTFNTFLNDDDHAKFLEDVANNRNAR